MSSEENTIQGAPQQPKIFGKLIELLEDILEKKGTEEGIVMAKRIIDYPEKITNFILLYTSAIISGDFSSEEDVMRKDMTTILRLIEEIKAVYNDAPVVPNAPANTPVDSDESS